MAVTALFSCLSSRHIDIAQSFVLELHQQVPVRSSLRPRSSISYHMLQRDDDGADDDWPEPTLEESFDAIDDVYLEKPPGRGRDKIKVFGAWLDVDVAGRKAGRGNRAAALIERASRGEKLTDAEQAEVFYEEAIVEMKRGLYDTSYGMLEKAVALAGEDSRRGGEFKLWAVQALQGVGRNEQSVKLLKSMENHSDPDVRKVSSELLFIAEAPLLELGQEDYVPFSDMSYISKGSESSVQTAAVRRVPKSNEGPEENKISEATQAEEVRTGKVGPALLTAAGAGVVFALLYATITLH